LRPERFSFFGLHLVFLSCLISIRIFGFFKKGAVLFVMLEGEIGESEVSKLGVCCHRFFGFCYFYYEEEYY
jgi:hypothetical protein